MLSLVLPRHLGGGDYTDYRLIAVALSAGCLAIDWAPPRLILWAAPLLYLVRLGVTASAWQPVLPDCPARTGRNSTLLPWRARWKTEFKNDFYIENCCHSFVILMQTKSK